MYTHYTFQVITSTGATRSIYVGSSRYLTRASVASLLRLARSRHVAAFCTVSTTTPR